MSRASFPRTGASRWACSRGRERRRDQHVCRAPIGEPFRLAKRAQGLCGQPAGRSPACSGCSRCPIPARTPTRRRCVCNLASCVIRVVWKYCQYYSIVFGGFTALSIWMRSIRQSISFPDRHGRADGGLLLASGRRAARGWRMALGPVRCAQCDVVGLWAAWICLFLLSYPQTDLIIQTVRGPHRLPHRPACLDVRGAAVRPRGLLRLRHGLDLQIYRRRFPYQYGRGLGIVGMAGGLGGFLLPIMFGALLDLLGIPSSCFMLLYGIVWGLADPLLFDRSPALSGDWCARPWRDDGGLRSGEMTLMTSLTYSQGKAVAPRRRRLGNVAPPAQWCRSMKQSGSFSPRVWSRAPEEVPLNEAGGRILASAILARRMAPACDVAAMDGYAVRSADMTAERNPLTVIGKSFAGHGFAGVVPAGAAVRIFTERRSPRVPTESSSRRTRNGSAARSSSLAPPASAISGPPLRLRRGRCIGGRGCAAHRGRLVAAAAADIAEVIAFARPRVTIVATGDELRAPGADSHRKDSIPESVTFGIAELARIFRRRSVRPSAPARRSRSAPSRRRAILEACGHCRDNRRRIGRRARLLARTCYARSGLRIPFLKGVDAAGQAGLVRQGRAGLHLRPAREPHRRDGHCAAVPCAPDRGGWRDATRAPRSDGVPVRLSRRSNRPVRSNAFWRAPGWGGSQRLRQSRFERAAGARYHRHAHPTARACACGGAGRSRRDA